MGNGLRSGTRRIGSIYAVVLAAFAVFSHGASAIDVWDQATIKDNTAASTQNYLNGPVGVNAQTHDLEAIGGVADEDWYIVEVEPGRSYAIAVTTITGDVDTSQTDFLQRFDATGGTLLQSHGGSGPGFRTLRWISSNSGYERIRVKGQPTSSARSQYSIVSQLSTYFCPRYNNSGSQVSVLIMQNISSFSCPATVYFLDEAGNTLATDSSTIAANATRVFAVGSLPALVGTRGSARIAHTCSAYVFKAKLVALEPATGFSFDTMCDARR